ncbi:TPA: hypothetical protein DIC20_01690 [Candidatus Dependentiae bacterium]|nr:hypothetical protein [Candidatus Dependentiae bacterium]
MRDKHFPRNLFRKEVFFAQNNSLISDEAIQNETRRILRSIFWGTAVFIICYSVIICMYLYTHKFLFQSIRAFSFF